MIDKTSTLKGDTSVCGLLLMLAVCVCS